MSDVCNPLQLAELIEDFWSPRVIGRVDNYYVKLARLKGEFVWHSHDEQDEMFYLLDGELTMEYEDKIVSLISGDLHVVPRGVMHNPVAKQECVVMLFEHKGTEHTGDIKVKGTKSVSAQILSGRDISRLNLDVATAENSSKSMALTADEQK